MKKALAVLLAIAYLASFGAFAADEHKCKAGEKWDATKKECVKK